MMRPHCADTEDNQRGGQGRAGRPSFAQLLAGTAKRFCKVQDVRTLQCADRVVRAA